MDIFDNLKKTLGIKPRSVIGLDIGSSSLKMIELKHGNQKPELLKYGTLALGPYRKANIGETVKLSNDKLASAIQTLFEAVGAVGTKGAISIPLKLSLIVTIDMPDSVKNKLETAVPLEARKYIPVAPKDVNIAWSVISESDGRSMSKQVDKKNSQMMKVLVAAIHNSTISNYNEIAVKSSLNPSILEIETFSAIRSVFGGEKGTFALIDIGSEVSKIVIIDYGSISVSHSINRGSHTFTKVLSNSLGIDFKDAEVLKRKEGMLGSYGEEKLMDIIKPDVDFILNEASQVLHTFEKVQGKKITKVILIGGGALLRGLEEEAKNILGKEVLLGDPFSKVELPTKALGPILKGSGPEYAVAIGLALRALEEL